MRSNEANTSVDRRCEVAGKVQFKQGTDAHLSVTAHVGLPKSSIVTLGSERQLRCCQDVSGVSNAKGN